VAKTEDVGLPLHAYSSPSSHVEVAAKDLQWRDEAVGGTEDASDDTFAADSRVEPSHVVHVYFNSFMQPCGALHHEAGTELLQFGLRGGKPQIARGQIARIRPGFFSEGAEFFPSQE
jgi:hypothetical protein